MNICIYGSASNLINPQYLKAGEQLGKALAQRSHGVVFGGGAEGMMGAVARGVVSKGGKLIGISPTFFKVDGVLYDGCTEFIYTETIRERKKLLEEKSDGFIVTPGGIGTFDEFFDILSLRQLRRHNKPIVLFNVSGYFDPIIKMLETAAANNFMKDSNLTLYVATDDCDKAISYIENFVSQNGNVEDYR